MQQASEGEEYRDDERPEVSGASWTIETLADADWALKRLGEIEAEKLTALELFRSHVKALETRRDRLVAKADRGLAFFQAHLRKFAEKNRGALLTGKAKSRSLYYGRIGWRSKAPSLEVKDPAAFEAWCLDTGNTKVKTEPSLTKAKKHFEETGEIPAGAEPTPETDEFFAKAEVE